LTRDLITRHHTEIPGQARDDIITSRDDIITSRDDNCY
jgi:hypothetical protein